MEDYYKRMCINAPLSEDYIRENKTKLSWEDICKHQTFSEEFFIEFKDIVYCDILLLRIKEFDFSNEFVIKNILPKCTYKTKINFIFYSDITHEDIVLKYIKDIKLLDLKIILLYKVFSREFYIEILDFLVKRFNKDSYYYLTNIDEDILLGNKTINENFKHLVRTKILSKETKIKFLSINKYKNLILDHQPLIDIIDNLSFFDKLCAILNGGNINNNKNILHRNFYRNENNKYIGYIYSANDYEKGKIIYESFTGSGFWQDFDFDIIHACVYSEIKPERFMHNIYMVEFNEEDVFKTWESALQNTVTAKMLKYKIIKKVND